MEKEGNRLADRLILVPRWLGGRGREIFRAMMLRGKCRTGMGGNIGGTPAIKHRKTGLLTDINRSSRNDCQWNRGLPNGQ